MVRVAEDQLDLWLIGGVERLPATQKLAARSSVWPSTKILVSASC